MNLIELANQPGTQQNTPGQMSKTGMIPGQTDAGTNRIATWALYVTFAVGSDGKYVQYTKQNLYQNC